MHDHMTSSLLDAVRRDAPLVHNITNLVVMQTTANALLALGASPVMAHAVEEMPDIAAISSALVLNIGTLSPAWVESMRLALTTANSRGVPVVIDPVGAGASRYRTSTALELLEASHNAILRGNASEIAALAGLAGTTKGVDSTLDVGASVQSAEKLALRYGCTVCISGSIDVITNGRERLTVEGGSPLMARVTGMGCTASAFCGAFAAVAGPDKRMEATYAAMAVMSTAGGLAAQECRGPGSFPAAFFDRVYALTMEDIAGAARLGA